MEAVRIGGSAKIAAVARALRRLGADRTIVNEMAKNIRKSAPGMRKVVKQSARDKLPKRGGLGKWVASSSIRASVKRGTRSAGVTLVVGKNSAGGRSDIAGIDDGGIRHPLWGNRKHWYPQQVTPGFGTAALEGPIADQFRTDVQAAIDTAVRQVLDVI